MPTAVMPTGVEHYDTLNVPYFAGDMPTAVMPTGVEHIWYLPYARSPDYVYRRDARRR